MSNLIVVLMGGLSGERKISFLTGKACSSALKKKGYKVINLDAKGYFVEKLRKLKPTTVFNALHGKYGEVGKSPIHAQILYAFAYVFAMFAAYPAPIMEAAFGCLHKGAAFGRPPYGFHYGCWGGGKHSKKQANAYEICGCLYYILPILC